MKKVQIKLTYNPETFDSLKVKSMNLFQTDLGQRLLSESCDHPRRVNASDRQICCKTCHACLKELREVLDGELWCDGCQIYR